MVFTFPSVTCQTEPSFLYLFIPPAPFFSCTLCTPLLITFSDQTFLSAHYTILGQVNPLTPNDHYSGRTAPLTSKRYILYIYSTNTGTEYFKYDIYCPFFHLQNADFFIILTYLVPVLFTFYIQGVLKFKKIIPPPKG